MFSLEEINSDKQSNNCVKQYMPDLALNGTEIEEQE